MQNFSGEKFTQGIECKKKNRATKFYEVLNIFAKGLYNSQYVIHCQQSILQLYEIERKYHTSTTTTTTITIIIRLFTTFLTLFIFYL